MTGFSLQRTKQNLIFYTMKKILFFFIASPFCLAQNVHFADANFKASIIKTYPAVDANSDQEISYDEAKTLTAIRNVQSVNFTKFTSAVGIEAFINLTELDLKQNNITTIDLSANTKIKTLNLRENQIAGNLDLTTLSELSNLDLNSNSISALQLPQSGKIAFLYANDNQLATLDLAHQTALKRLFLVRNKITDLDVSAATVLERLQLDENELSAVDFSELTKLNWVSLQKNKLQSLVFKNNPALKSLLLQDNLLETLNFQDALPHSVTLINLTGNASFSVVLKDCNDSISGITPTNIEIQDNCASLAVSDSNAFNIRILPNPFTDFIEFEKEVMHLEVFDFSGRKLRSFPSALKRVNLSELKAGVYLLKFSVNGSYFSKKVVKK